MMAGYKSRIRGNWLISLETESFLFPTYLFLLLLLLFLSSYQKKKERKKECGGMERKECERTQKRNVKKRKNREENARKGHKRRRKNERKRARRRNRRRKEEIDSFGGNLFDNLNKAMNVTFMWQQVSFSLFHSFSHFLVTNGVLNHPLHLLITSWINHYLSSHIHSRLHSFTLVSTFTFTDSSLHFTAVPFSFHYQFILLSLSFLSNFFLIFFISNSSSFIFYLFLFSFLSFFISL